mmetsp:Transcript_6181/g.12953  ORF Transcript_6181/g.12953 Transcript_6181/m.12953 type:complete len:168 (-) Transcript_6181:99-602(-)
MVAPAMKKWEFNLDCGAKLPSALGSTMHMGDSDGSSVAMKNKKDNIKALQEKKAWEVALGPIKQVGMQLFMLWMSGSSPGIFSVMIMSMLISSSVSQLGQLTTAFEKFDQVETVLQKLVFALTLVAALAFVLYHASNMGLVPTQTGDWVSYMEPKHMAEHVVPMSAH